MLAIIKYPITLSTFIYNHLFYDKNVYSTVSLNVFYHLLKNVLYISIICTVKPQYRDWNLYLLYPGVYYICPKNINHMMNIWHSRFYCEIHSRFLSNEARFHVCRRVNSHNTGIWAWKILIMWWSSFVTPQK